jgi:hypothetical protein
MELVSRSVWRAHDRYKYPHGCTHDINLQLHIQCDAIGAEIKQHIDEQMCLNPRLYHSLRGLEIIPYHGNRFPNSHKSRNVASF